MPIQRNSTSVPRYLTRTYQDKILSHPNYANPAITQRYVDIASYENGYTANNARAIVSDLTNRAIEQASGYTPNKRDTLDWFKTVDYSNGYDNKVEERLRAENRYLELADYLSAFKFNNPIEQLNYETEIYNLRQYGLQYNAIHGAASTQNDHDALSFNEAFNNGSIDELDEKNTFKRGYKDVIRTLGKSRRNIGTQPYAPNMVGQYDDTREASTISVTFDNKKNNYFLGFDFLAKDDENEDQYNEFIKASGYSIGEIKNLFGNNAISYDDNKRTVITVDKSNLRAIEFLKRVGEWADESGRNFNDVSYASYDENGKLITDDNYTIKTQLNNVTNLLNRASSTNQKVLDRLKGSEEIQDVQILPYMNEYQKNIQTAAFNRQISPTEAKALIDADNENYGTLLLAEAFINKEIYTNLYNNGNSQQLSQLDKENIGDFREYLSLAISEKRATWSAGIVNGTFGTFITITPKQVKNEFVTDEKNPNIGANIFIPNLYTESIQSAFNSSTDGKAVAEINNMQRYGYEKTLSNGSTISKVGNNGAVYYNSDDGSTQTISRADAQRIIHEDIMLNDITNGIKTKLYDINGNIRRGYDYRIDAKRTALTAINELYPEVAVTEEDVWPSDEKTRELNEATGNIYKDRQIQRVISMYAKIENSIFNYLNNR